jgi:hypothetical protein
MSSPHSVPSPQSSVLIYGIRHHGPGSARSLKQALEQLKPDVILVEGPPDAQEVLSLLAHEEMQPPVALLIYAPDQPQNAVYYPFAIFSPEWQAIHYGLSNNIPVRFMDLPIAHQFHKVEENATNELGGLVAEPTDEIQPEGEAGISDENSVDNGSAEAVEAKLDLETFITNLKNHPRHDPLRWIAEAAGYNDSERWWEDMVEHRRDSTDLFAAILEAMIALRTEIEAYEAEVAAQQSSESTHPTPNILFPDLEREALREAWMRQTIRAAQKEGFQCIAVVCGAWHAPALHDMPPAKDDAALLKNLPKTKAQATWVPWTYGRLCFASGYGAGIESPGWYHHLWTSPDRLAVRWMARVAALLREQDLDASSAHVIEAVRLAETLAALRNRPLPGLPELNEAVQAILCFGNDLPLQLIHDKLIVSETLGQVPEDTPTVPLQQDLVREQKRLRLSPEASQRVLDLDLRKPNDLERSYLLHRLDLLGIPWGKSERGYGGKGTFHELWRLQWQPEFAVAIIEAAVWGNTVAEAAAAYTRSLADKAPDLPTLTALLSRVLLASLPEASKHVMQRLEVEAAIASDVLHLMEALPPLCNVQRYGDVRQTDVGMVGHIVDGLVARICIGLPLACSSLDDEAAAAMVQRINSVQSAIALLQNAEHTTMWQATLGGLSTGGNQHALIAGRCCRILLDTGALPAEETARRMSRALSAANEPAQAAAWVEGFLQGSGALLLHDERLWQVLDEWISGLHGDTFQQLLPLLRRTFSTFTAPERRQMGERVAARGLGVGGRELGMPGDSDGNFDAVRAEAVLPVIAQLLGLQQGQTPTT